MSWRNSTEYRLWRIRVIRRDKICKICGDRKTRHVHHLNDASNHPMSRFDPENGICLCREHHTMFHCSYKHSFQDKCTIKDWYNFVEMYNAVKLEIKDKIIRAIKEV